MGNLASLLSFEYFDKNWKLKPLKSINDNQVKNIDVDTNTVSFTIRNRKHKINKSEGSITLWRIKATQYRNTFTDEGGRVREEKKKRKTREEIEVVLPINK